MFDQNDHKVNIDLDAATELIEKEPIFITKKDVADYKERERKLKEIAMRKVKMVEKPKPKHSHGRKEVTPALRRKMIDSYGSHRKRERVDYFKPGENKVVDPLSEPDFSIKRPLSNFGKDILEKKNRLHEESQNIMDSVRRALNQKSHIQGIYALQEKNREKKEINDAINELKEKYKHTIRTRGMKASKQIPEVPPYISKETSFAAGEHGIAS